MTAFIFFSLRGSGQDVGRAQLDMSGSGSSAVAAGCLQRDLVDITPGVWPCLSLMAASLVRATSVSAGDERYQLNRQRSLRVRGACQLFPYVKLLIEPLRRPKEAGAVVISLPAQEVQMWDLNPEQPYY